MATPPARPSPVLHPAITHPLLAILVAAGTFVGARATAPTPAPNLHRGLGLTIPVSLAHPVTHVARRLTIPASVDLSADLPPVGDQSFVGSCASWATGYYLRGWYANQAGTYPAGGFAAMSLYSQIAQANGGHDQGSSLEQPMALLQTFGDTPAAAYPNLTTDYQDLPNAAETAAAAPWKINGYQEIWTPNSTSTALDAIEQYIATTHQPVVIGFEVTPNYEAYTGGVLVDQGGQILGGHANLVYGYSPQGLLYINQWGPAYGVDGRGIMGSSYSANYLFDAVVAMGMPAPPAPTATASPPPSATPPVATSTPVASATPHFLPTAPPRPTPTVALLSWPAAGVKSLPPGLPHGVYDVREGIYDDAGRLVAKGLQRIRH